MSLKEDISRLRDKYDELSVSFNQVGELEECNETIHNGLASYSKAMTLLADVTDLEVHRIHGKVTAFARQAQIQLKFYARWTFFTGGAGVGQLRSHL